MSKRWVLLGLVAIFFLSVPSASEIIELVSPNNQRSGEFGDGIASLPDVNGDGIAEIAVGAPFESDIETGPFEFETGAVHVFDGKTQQLLYSLSYLLPSATFETPGFGWQLAGLSDLDQDGKGELLVGAGGVWDATGNYWIGRAFVYSGQEVLFDLESSFPIYGGNFGDSVGMVPDVNEDGIVEFVVGARGESSEGQPERSGKVYLFDGKTGNLIRILVSPNPSEDAEFGDTACGIMDLNGNGSGEIVVGAPKEEVGGKQDGRVYVFDGRTGDVIYSLVSPNAEINGDNRIAFFGFDLSCVPDVNGDGFDDLLVGAYAETLPGGNSTSGSAYVFSGVDGALIHSLFTVNEMGAGLFGGAVSGIEDINGDGSGDILIGANMEWAESGLGFVGRGYLFDGRTGGVFQVLRSPNEQYGGTFGTTVLGIDDVNGDRLSDFLVGAPFEDVDDVYRGGRVYLYLSPFYHRCDLNEDGNVDSLDLRIFSADWHKVSGP